MATRINHTVNIAIYITIVCVIFVPGLAWSDPYWLFLERPAGWVPGDTVDSMAVERIEEYGYSVRIVSRYFNAVSVDAETDAESLRLIDGVIEVRPVAELFRGQPEYPAPPVLPAKRALHAAESPYSRDYGHSLRQLDILGIPALHERGLTGTGVKIGIPDTGFDIAGTGCLANLTIGGTRDFIRGGENVTGDNHGVLVLACLAGEQEGSYYGAAFGAEVYLALTDDVSTETRADEDRWVAAVEWFDSLGVDILSSSVGYNLFDTTVENYTKSQMDGRTSLVAQAAEIAASRGIIVVCSAGNEGNNSWRIILTPADAEHVIAVGAVTYTGNEPVITALSSRGPTADGRIKPDVVAPGENITVPLAGTANFFYAANGTSFAAPLVAGLCALLLEEHPGWGPAEIAEALKSTAIDLGASGPDNTYGWGLPDAAAASAWIPAGVTDSESDDTPRPSPVNIGMPYPNPFNVTVSIPFTVAADGRVSVLLFDAAGQMTACLTDDFYTAGRHELSWNGTGAASGTYIVRARIQGGTASRKILLLK